MRHTNNVDPITDAQNEGKACQHCGSRFGHYRHCSTLGGLIAQFAGFTGSKTAPLAPAKLPVLNTGDHILLHTLGVAWEGDYR